MKPEKPISQQCSYTSGERGSCFRNSQASVDCGIVNESNALSSTIKRVSCRSCAYIVIIVDDKDLKAI